MAVIQKYVLLLFSLHELAAFKSLSYGSHLSHRHSLASSFSPTAFAQADDLALSLPPETCNNFDPHHACDVYRGVTVAQLVRIEQAV